MQNDVLAAMLRQQKEDVMWHSAQTMTIPRFVRLKDDRGIAHLINIDHIVSVTEYIDEDKRGIPTIQITIAHKGHIYISMSVDEFQKHFDGGK